MWPRYRRGKSAAAPKTKAPPEPAPKAPPAVAPDPHGPHYDTAKDLELAAHYVTLMKDEGLKRTVVRNRLHCTCLRH